MLDGHWDYVSDAGRSERFEAAIRQSTYPHSKVLDLGCGVGILGMLCLRAGAAEVVAVDRTAIVDVARESFARAGHAGKARAVRGIADRIKLSEPVDLIVCDHVGYFGIDYGIVELLIDARQRFLSPAGSLIPASVELLLAPVESAASRAKADRWASEGVPEELHWLRKLGVNAKHPVSLAPNDLLGPPVGLGTIDFLSETRSFFSFRAELVVERAGELHGIGGWFDCTLAPNVTMTNSPLDPERIDRPQAFLPIETPIPVEAGDVIEATVAMRPGDNLIAWTVRHPASGEQFRHSTWAGMVLGAPDLLRAKPDHVPRLSADARARSIVLGYCDGLRTVREIEEAILRDHPDLFPSSEAITAFVAGVLGRETE